ncbi:hypothetical protein Ae201684P_006709 [Aphanomyces euteiches]|uniref:Alpha 1,4-glycosyltransferase domain-containing protein n=1 Tax=Aphanomyces euteiches TaxID=100861 RepID=A0A6G0X8Y2_9STRA|nr:hypothetical protein Ae201684_007431 [Aphanomyces euteiches]KAH9100512.1 hypothetical protein Ae201684P_006709 [Aphanomyces euteiches]KAH9155077.1 hypothetical protein AeRB84_002910 [Aphanomyces euteiches]
MHLLPAFNLQHHNAHDAKTRPSHGFLMKCAVCFLLVFVGYNISNVSSIDTAREALARSAQEETIVRDDQPPVCRVQFVFTGSKYNYAQFPTLQSWIRYTDSKCVIEFILANHPFMTQLTPAHARMFYESDYLPILQADMLKMFAVYYLGGLAVDLDVEALKPFPSQWIGPDTALATCDVVLGIERDCYDNNCLSSWRMRRKGQIQNWAMYARKPRSTFFGELLDFTVDRYERFHVPHGPNATVEVQEIAGSGVITDFVQLFGNFSKPLHLSETSPQGPSLVSDKTSVLRIKKNGEEVCIVGSRYTGFQCSQWPECILHHHYEGSWKTPSP